ncbi:large secreted protein [Rhodopirellula sp. SWK7]|nr:large secreted protein [Rhodopirellula sp. SWK7]
MPIGNGRLGAMVFGGIREERLQLNEDTLWSGGPQNYDNPDALEHLADVRALLEKGEYADAEATAQKMMGKPIYQSAYQPLGDLYLRFPQGEQASDYRRELDLRNAVSTVSYRVGDARFTRKVFASQPDQVIVMRLECDQPGRLSFDLSLTSQHPSQSQMIEDDTLGMTGQVAPRTDTGLSGSRALIGPWEADGMKFAAQVKIANEGGTVDTQDDAIFVRDADAVTLYYSAATNFVNSKNISGDPVESVQKYLGDIQAKTFDQLYQRHFDDYGRLFGRVALDLGGKETESVPTDIRIERMSEGKADPVLVELAFQYGRYLMIAGSRPGTQPLNLQGIWNNDLNPPWGSKYTININIEMNYWVAEVCNLGECHEPLLRMVGELEEPGKNTAEVHYQAEGWMAHHNTDLWRGTAPVDGAQWGMWPMGGAWLCQHLWEHYLFSRDDEHLKNSYPVMKGAVAFFLDALVENEDGYLITSPSLSPEHSHGGGTKDGLSVGRSGISLCAGPTIDMQILRDLFANCIAASEILDVDQEFRSIVKDARARLAPMKVGRHGQLQEWLVDWDNPEDHHSHVSHMYGLYPSCQINPHDTPELFAAARTSLIHRGDSGGWPGAWRISLWARLGDGDHANSVLSNRVIPGLNRNLLNGRRVFQIDANFGATAGIAEMLLQSQRGEIQLLPALPADWPTGSFKGLRARDGFEVDAQWSAGKLSQAAIRSGSGNTCRIRSDIPFIVTQDNQSVETKTTTDGVLEFSTESGKEYLVVPKT